MVWFDTRSKYAPIAEDEEYRNKKLELRVISKVLKCLVFVVFLVLLIGIIKGNFTSVTTASSTISASGALPMPICGLSIYGINIHDFARMAKGPYLTDPTSAPDTWTTYPNIAKFTAGDPDDNPSSSCAFQEYIAPSPSNLTVIAVRGTKNVDDAYQDLYSYASSVTLQASTQFGTLVNLWPSVAVATLVSFISNLGRNGETLGYWESVATRVELVMKLITIASIS
jgi:hypothetical protein